jgi:N-acetyl-gamma-glutamyl-phosphate reductase common form
MSTLSVGIVGVNGYVGSELARLVLQHPKLRLVAATSRRHAGEPLGDVLPALAGFTDLTVMAPDWAAFSELDVVIFATPHGVSRQLMPKLEAFSPPCVIDMSADHRHADGWVYAQPEWLGESVAGAKRLAIPGCFATAMALALAPMAAANAIRGAVCVSGVTGSTGSGADAKKATHHPERFANYKAYKTLSHQHIPELRQFLGIWGPAPIVHFVPHSGPFDRGIFATCFIPCDKGFEGGALYEAAYGDTPLVRLRAGTPELRWVRGTGFCDLSIHQADGHLVVLSAIDNLGRGAAFQGLQALNTAKGWAQETGLWAPSLTP